MKTIRGLFLFCAFSLSLVVAVAGSGWGRTDLDIAELALPAGSTVFFDGAPPSIDGPTPTPGVFVPAAGIVAEWTADRIAVGDAPGVDVMVGRDAGVAEAPADSARDAP